MLKYPGFNANGCMKFLSHHANVTIESYKIIHQEITKLAGRYINQYDTAQDIASECLIQLWQQSGRNDSENSIMEDIIKMITNLCAVNSIRTNQQRQSEHHFIQEQLVRLPAYTTFRIAEKEVVLQLSHLLPTAERAVIHFILADELDLPEISVILKRPVPTIKILRDRAIVMLRKLSKQVLGIDEPLHQR
jgi:DNA-directed RNA polymerase specialized sigma24 family protein